VTLFDLDFLNNKISDLEAVQNKEDFWNDQKSALKIIDDYNETKETRDTYVKIEKTHADLKDLLFACTESDEDMRALIEEMLSDLEKEVKIFRTRLLFKRK